MNNLKIAISGLNNTDNPAPGIGVAKSLKSRKYDLIGLSYDVNEPGIYQGLFKSVYLMPYPNLGIKELLTRLKEIIKKEDKIDIIIPTLDAELPLYIKHKSEIEKLGIKVLLPDLTAFELRDKTKLIEISKKLKTKTPETFIVSNITELKQVVEMIGYPFFIKGKYYKAYKVTNWDLAVNYFSKISNEWGFPLIVQKPVNGIEINYVGLGNGKKLVGGVAAKKLLTTDLGKFWTGISIKNEKLLEVAKKFVKLTNWKGPFEIEAIVNNIGDIYLIEINPRFPAWCYFSTQLGINLPEMLVKILSGKRIKSKFEYSTNKLYIRYVEETVADFETYSELLKNKEINIKDKK